MDKIQKVDNNEIQRIDVEAVNFSDAEVLEEAYTPEEISSSRS